MPLSKETVFLIFIIYLYLAAWFMGSWFPNQGSNWYPQHWKYRVLTTGPPGKPQDTVFLNIRTKGIFPRVIKIYLEFEN